MSTYARPHLTFEQQLTALKARGLAVTNDETALSYLRRLGYYRLSAYWYAFRQSKLEMVGDKPVRRVGDSFQEGASFQSAVDLYVFDKKLRLLVLDAVERIEVALRVDIAYHLGQRNTFAHCSPDELHGHFSKKVRQPTGKTDHQAWMDKLDQTTLRSKEEFVKHYRQTYGLPLPIWVAIEVWDFGLLSHFYGGMKPDDKAALAVRFGVVDPAIMETWLRAINFVRNISAHHGRLFNRNMVDYPEFPVAGAIPAFDPVLGAINKYRPYATLCIIAFLMRAICPSSTWAGRLSSHLSQFPVVGTSGVAVSSMGCHEGWEQEPFWPPPVDVQSTGAPGPA